MLAVLIQVTAGKVMRSGGTWQYTFHQQVTIKHQNVIVIVLIHRLVLVKNYYFYHITRISHDHSADNYDC